MPLILQISLLINLLFTCLYSADDLYLTIPPFKPDYLCKHLHYNDPTKLYFTSFYITKDHGLTKQLYQIIVYISLHY